MHGFDRLAPIYDGLARMIFGSTIDAAQRVWLSLLTSKQHVLFIGGGTGRILPELLETCPATSMTYLELSPRMLAQAQRRVKGTADQTRIHWQVGTQEDLPAHVRYDGLITFFLLDLFSPNRFDALMDRLDQHVAPGGIWLFTDFVPQTGWQRSLLRVMYWFFRQTCGIDGRNELPFGQAFEKRGYELIKETRFFFGMIAARGYQKKPF